MSSLSRCVNLRRKNIFCRFATDLVLKQGHKVSVDQIDPTEISGAVFNSSVCLQQIRYMFTEEAWERFQFYYESKSEHSRFACNGCKKSEENGDDLISCEHCLTSYHLVCVRFRKDVKKRP